MGHRRLGDGRLAGIHRSLFAPLNDIMNLLPMHRQFDRRLDPQFDRVLINAQDFDGDASIDDDAFVEFAGED